jgi:hypothetical protein
MFARSRSRSPARPRAILTGRAARCWCVVARAANDARSERPLGMGTARTVGRYPRNAPVGDAVLRAARSRRDAVGSTSMTVSPSRARGAARPCASSPPRRGSLRQSSVLGRGVSQQRAAMPSMLRARGVRLNLSNSGQISPVRKPHPDRRWIVCIQLGSPSCRSLSRRSVLYSLCAQSCALTRALAL